MTVMKGVLLMCMMASVQGVRVGDVEQTNSSGMQLSYIALYGEATKQMLCFWNVEQGFLERSAIRGDTWNQWKPVLLRALKRVERGKPKQGKPCGRDKKKGTVDMNQINDMSGEDVCASCCGPECEDNAAYVLEDAAYRNGFFTWSDSIKGKDSREAATVGLTTSTTRMLNTYPKMDNRAEVFAIQSRFLQKMPGGFKVGDSDAGVRQWFDENSGDPVVDKSRLEPPMKFGDINMFMVGVEGV